MYLIIALAIAFSIAAAVWVGGIARENVLEQHVRRLSLETDQLSTDLGQALTARLSALSTLGMIVQTRQLANPNDVLNVAFQDLVSAYPQFDWLAVADATGAIVASDGSFDLHSRVEDSRWFREGLQGTWLGVIDHGQGQSRDSAPPTEGDVAALGDMAAPVRDATGHILGVVAAHLSWRRAPQHTLRLTDEPYSRRLTEAYVLDRENVVLIGPEGSRDRPWNGVRIDESDSAADAADAKNLATPVFERLPDGRHVLVARESLTVAGALASLGLQVQLSEPNERVFQRANAVAAKILWVSLCLGGVTVIIGSFGARQLTRRLLRLTLSVRAVRKNATLQKIEVPRGHDEVAQLGEAFARLIDELEQERSELKLLSGELERRVAIRTDEVQRLAEESRHTALVRERLTMARDLHDTLAHSMMAIVSEIRFIRKLQTHDPASVANELARAEQLAHEGLKEARSAIAQMRGTTVREIGLGPALAHAFERFIDHTGLKGKFSADPEAARFGEERGEVVLRMAREALRNVERHAVATSVAITLRMIDDGYLVVHIEDDGVGFDIQTQRPGHYGLVGLHEQADLIGASLTVDSRPQAGTRVTISLRISPVVFGQNTGHR